MSHKKEINLSENDRFVDTNTLRLSYIDYDETRAPGTPRYITLSDGLELGIVASQEPSVAKAISSILSRSLEDAKASSGGYIPDSVVERVQTEIISPFGVANIWGITGHRFVLSIPANNGTREIVASILVGRSKDTIFFFTGKYNNLRYSTMAQDVDLDQPDDNHPDKKWFDRFAFPELSQFKPNKYHHIANFVVTKEHRGKGYSRLLLDSIMHYYSRDYIEKYDLPILHCQHLLCGVGFWQIGDPPWLSKMEKLGFWLRAGAESFFIEHDWAPLDPVYKFGKRVANHEYNEQTGLFKSYGPIREQDWAPPHPDVHLRDRIAKVLRLAQNPNAKLQYFQACYNFLDHNEPC